MVRAKLDDPVIATARDAALLFGPILAAAPGERLLVAYLDAGRGLLRLTAVGGGADEVKLPVRGIVEEALREGARGLVLAHNHPSGDPLPSEADRDGTRRLAESAGAMGLVLHDHLIVAGGEWVSFRALGLL